MIMYRIALTIEASLQAAAGSVAPAGGAPATLWPGDALGALGELEALRGARVPPGEQAATLTRLAAQRNEGRTHALRGGEEAGNTSGGGWLNSLTRRICRIVIIIEQNAIRSIIKTRLFK